MPKQSKAARLIQELQDWSDEELGDLAEMIQGLLESRREEAEDRTWQVTAREKRSGAVVIRSSRTTLKL